MVALAEVFRGLSREEEIDAIFLAAILVPIEAQVVAGAVP
jgi:hypothetical protein